MPFRFAVALVTLLFGVVIGAMPPAFQTNDDAIMSMIVSGQGVTLAPDEHLIFTNVIIGNALKTLYTEYPAFHWYGWYLVATQWVATIAILYSLHCPRYTRLRILGFAAYFLTAGIYFLVNLQFTSTASLTGIAAGLLLLQVLRPAGQSRIMLGIAAGVATLFLIWAGLIRSETFVLSMLLVYPVLFTCYMFGTASRGAAASVGLSLAAAAGLMFFADRYHHDYYNEPDWKDFYQYNALRVKFNDEQWVSYSPESKHVFDQVGWHKIDMKMICNWYYDGPVFDKEKLSSILSSYEWSRERNLWRTVRFACKDVFRQRTFLAIICCLPVMLLFLDRRRSTIWPCAAALITAVGILLAITILRKTPPERVFMPVFAFPWLVVLGSLTTQRQRGQTERHTLSRMAQAMRTAWQFRHWSWFQPGAGRYLVLRSASLLLGIGLILNLVMQSRYGKAHARNAQQYQAMLADLRPAANEGERLVLAYGSDFPYEYQAALFGSNDYSGFQIFSIGWPQRTPFAERMKQHFEITDLAKALVTRDDVVLAANPVCKWRFVEFLRTHERADTRAVMTKDYGRYALLTFAAVPNSEISGSAPEAIWDRIQTVAQPFFENLRLRR